MSGGAQNELGPPEGGPAEMVLPRGIEPLSPP